jgi:hypothetical protein
MMHPEIQRVIAAQHIELLRRDYQRSVGPRAEPVDDPRPIELRLCRVGDLGALAELAELNDRRLPEGSFVVALVAGRIVAAQPVDGGPLLADPFAHTAHLGPLLEVRAAQLRPRSRRSLRLFGAAQRATA